MIGFLYFVTAHLHYLLLCYSYPLPQAFLLREHECERERERGSHLPASSQLVLFSLVENLTSHPFPLPPNPNPLEPFFFLHRKHQRNCTCDSTLSRQRMRLRRNVVR
ncbi:hypothetical protein BDV06DRAFT_144838 [Aspergillus oleicola]